MTTSSFDSEFNSTPNGDTFIHGPCFGRIFTHISTFLLCKRKNLDNIFLRLGPRIKVSPFGVELISKSNELVVTTWPYSCKEF